MHCPRAPSPEQALTKAITETGLGLRFLACPGSPGWGFFPGLGSLVLFPGPCVFLSAFSFSFCFFSLTAGVIFQLPDGRASGQRQGHPPKNQYRAPTQGPAFSGTFIENVFAFSTYILDIKILDHLKMNIAFVRYIVFFCNVMDFAASGGLEGMKVVDIRRVIAPAPRMNTRHDGIVPVRPFLKGLRHSPSFFLDVVFF